MSPALRKRYRTVFEFDSTGWWVIHVPAIKGCHTQAKSLRQGRTRIREAMSLYIPNADSIELIEEINQGGDS